MAGLRDSAAMPSRADRRRIVGSLLRQMRLAKSLRQEDVASAMGRPQSYVSKYEAGEQSLDVIEVAEVCTALGTSLSVFVRRLKSEIQAKP